MKSKQLCRFSISIKEELLTQLDQMVKSKGYQNRSQAISSIVRDSLVENQAAQGNDEIAGTVTLVYDHHKARLLSQLTSIQHEFGGIIISVLHVHLDHNNCMEVLALRGPAKNIRRMADMLCALKGIKHAKLSVTTTGRDFH